MDIENGKEGNEIYGNILDENIWEENKYSRWKYMVTNKNKGWKGCGYVEQVCMYPGNKYMVWGCPIQYMRHIPLLSNNQSLNLEINH
jgi:hypothetical protein